MDVHEADSRRVGRRARHAVPLQHLGNRLERAAAEVPRVQPVQSGLSLSYADFEEVRLEEVSSRVCR